MTRILCIDPGTNFGWAHGEIGGKPIYGSHKLPQGVETSTQMLALERILMDMLKANLVEKLYFEEPILLSSNGFKSVAATMSKPFIIGLTARRLGIDSIPVAMQTWRSGFGSPQQAPKMKDDQLCDYMGWSHKKLTPAQKSSARRKWLKDATIAHCRKHGFDPQDDNASDAIGLFCSVSWKHGRALDEPQLDFQSGLAL